MLYVIRDTIGETTEEQAKRHAIFEIARDASSAFSSRHFFSQRKNEYKSHTDDTFSFATR